MTIIDKIKNSVETITGMQFVYESPQTINTRLDNMPMPCAFMNIIDQGVAIDDNGIIREQMTIQVMFCDLCELDFDGIDAEKILDRLKKIAFSWVANAMSSNEFKVKEILGTNRYYADNDAIVCAFSVSLQIEEIDGISKCSNI